MFGQILSEINNLVSTILMALMLRVVTCLAHYCTKHCRVQQNPQTPGWLYLHSTYTHSRQFHKILVLNL